MSKTNSHEPVVEDGTRQRILSAALLIFSERGFDAATLREITEAADANVAAVNYYFRSKDILIREVLETFTRPSIEARCAALDEVEQQAGGQPPTLEKVVEALVRPMVEFSRDALGGRAMIRLLMQVRALPREQGTAFFTEQFDAMALRFVNAFSRAVPNLNRAEIHWRYDFAIGAVMHVLADVDPKLGRLAGLSDGLCATDDEEVIIAQLVSFVSAGFRALAPRASRA